MLVSIFSYQVIAQIVSRSKTYCREVALEYRKRMQEILGKNKTKTRKLLRLEREQAVKSTDLLPEHIDYITCRETLTK
jgi:hypothetical protein